VAFEASLITGTMCRIEWRHLNSLLFHISDPEALAGRKRIDRPGGIETTTLFRGLRTASGSNPGQWETEPVPGGRIIVLLLERVYQDQLLLMMGDKSVRASLTSWSRASPHHDLGVQIRLTLQLQNIVVVRPPAMPYVRCKGYVSGIARRIM